MTTFAASIAPPDSFRVGRVMVRSLAIYARNLPLFAVLGAIMAAPELISALSGLTGAERPLAAYLGGIIVSPFSSGAAIAAAAAAVAGRPARLGPAIAAAWRRFAPMVVTNLCLGVVVVLGLLLLVVPGAIAATAWGLAPAACMLDGTGTGASLKRSAALTRGHRWRMLAMLVAQVVGIGVVIGISIALLAAAAFGIAAIVRTGAVPLWLVTLPTLTALGGFVVTTLAMPLFAIIPAVAYCHLRAIKDGIAGEGVAAVFE